MQAKRPLGDVETPAEYGATARSVQRVKVAGKQLMGPELKMAKMLADQHQKVKEARPTVLAPVEYEHMKTRHVASNTKVAGNHLFEGHRKPTHPAEVEILNLRT